MAKFVPTPIENISEVRERARNAFRSGKTRSIPFRKAQIAQVGYLIKDNESSLKEALKQDLGRPDVETEFFDFTASYIDLRYVYDNVEKWAAPQKAETTRFYPMKPQTKAEPKGTVLIIAPFNFPVFLTMGPLVGAIAAGNAAVIKPSEQTPAVSALLAELLPKYLDPELFHIVNGGTLETTKVCHIVRLDNDDYNIRAVVRSFANVGQLLELQWDHIFYTGGGRVGRIIAEAAAKFVTPLTLELGGKNPVVIDPKTDVKMAARRILWGRFSNAGQICLAPEYVLVPETFQETLVEAIKEAYTSFYQDNPRDSDSLSRVISEASARRIKRMLDDTKGTVILGGEVIPEERYVAPTVVSNVRGDDSLMQQEIFGPVLLLIPVKNLDAAIEFINARDHPLSVYIFSRDKSFQKKVSESTVSGGVSCNDVVLAPGVPGIPLGGIGPSGYGYNTGRHMFDQFTHIRAFMDSPSWVDTVAFSCRYPPYKSLKSLKFTTPALPPRPGQATGLLGRWILASFVLAGALAYATLTQW